MSQTYIDKLNSVILSTLLPIPYKDVGNQIFKIITNEVVPLMHKEEISFSEIDYYHYNFSEVIHSCAACLVMRTLDYRQVKTIISECWTKYVGYDIIQYIISSRILDDADSESLLEIVLQKMESNQKSISDIKNGKDKAIGAIVGSVMKEIKADPTKIKEIVLQNLHKF